MLQSFATTYPIHNNYYAYPTVPVNHSNIAVSVVFVVAVLIIAIISYVIEVVALWHVFVKAGRDGWPAIIPVYNLWILFEISGKPGWWALISILSMIPIFGIIASIFFIVLYIIAMLELAKRFNKSTVFAVFGLVIFAIIGLLILGFDSSKYNDQTTEQPPMNPQSNDQVTEQPPVDPQ